MDVTEYYNQLGHHWLHLDNYEAHDWDIPSDQEKFRQYIEKKRTLAFLLGLNQNLDGIKSRVMSTKPFPSLEEAFAEILGEEYRRDLMVTSNNVNNTPLPAEGSALAVRGQYQNKSGQHANQPRRDDDEDPYCDRCRRHGHTRAECWYLIGGPPGWKPANPDKKKKGKANLATATEQPQQSSPAATPFSKEQAAAMEKFFKLMVQNQPPSQNQPENFSSHFASQGKSSHAYSIQSKPCETWIIDSGCSDHMTGFKEVLTEFQSYPKKAGVRIADGTLSAVEGIGRVRINHDIELFPVLYVPKLSCSLISISQITRDLKC